MGNYRGFATLRFAGFGSPVNDPCRERPNLQAATLQNPSTTIFL